MQIKNFKDLVAWQKAMELAKQAYNVTTAMPDNERFGLTSQMRRAAVSAPSNIAEGYGRESLTDYVRFLKTARGSIFELETQLLLAQDLGFLRIPQELTQQLTETSRVLQGLISSLKEK